MMKSAFSPSVEVQRAIVDSKKVNNECSTRQATGKISLISGGFVTASVLDELSMSLLPAFLWTYLSKFILNWLPKRLQGKVQGNVHPRTGNEDQEAE